VAVDHRGYEEGQDSVSSPGREITGEIYPGPRGENKFYAGGPPKLLFHHRAQCTAGADLTPISRGSGPCASKGAAGPHEDIVSFCIASDPREF